MARFFCIVACCALCILIPTHGVAAPDREGVEARVRADVAKDLDTPWQPESLAGRACLDGRPAADFPGDIAEYWVNLEHPYAKRRQGQGTDQDRACGGYPSLKLNLLL